MSEDEGKKLEEEYFYLHILLDFYAKNRGAIQSMSDKEYKQHIDAILDKINEIKKQLRKEDDKNSKI